jgi:hypothetical protein
MEPLLLLLEKMNEIHKALVAQQREIDKLTKIVGEKISRDDFNGPVFCNAPNKEWEEYENSRHSYKQPNKESLESS